MSSRRPFAARPIAAATVLAAALACAAPDAPTTRANGPFGGAVQALRQAAVGRRDPTFGRRLVVAERGATVRPASAAAATSPQATPWDTAEVPSEVIAFTTVDGAPDTVWMGDTLVLAPPAPPAGTPSAIARDLRWTSAEQSVATVSAEGVVTPRRRGVAPIVAWRRVGQTVVPVTVLPAARGRVVAADGATPRVRVIVRAAAAEDTAWTAANGEFALRPRRAWSDEVSVRFDPVDPAHVPALLDLAPVESLHALHVVLLPARWRITAGSYAGQTIDIDPTVVHAMVRGAQRRSLVAHLRRDGAASRGGAVGWAPARLPLPLAFDRRAGDAAIAPSDSAAFWAIVRQLERDWGAPLFRPATLAPGDDGFGGVVATVDPRIGSAGLTTTGRNGDGDLYDAVVAVRTRALLADPSVVTHELLHALGVGHAPTARASIMHPAGDPFGPRRASAADIAYAHLLYAVRAG